MLLVSPEDFGFCPYCWCAGNAHKSGCPNQTKLAPEHVGYCDICKGGITSDEDRYDMDGTLYHRECFESEYLIQA